MLNWSIDLSHYQQIAELIEYLTLRYSLGFLSMAMGVNMLDCISTLSQNQLLSALSTPVKTALSAQLTLVKLPAGTVLYETGQASRHIYFPIDSLVSLLNVTSDGDTTEIAEVGSDGFVGMPLVTGGESHGSQAVVECSGNALRLSSQDAKAALERRGELFSLLLRYLTVFIGQIAQISICNRHHSIEQQLCRKLLLMIDRLHHNQLQLTQEHISDMLGVRRESITEAANKLQRCGAIHYRRGHIEILDRHLLEQHACECYSMIKQECEHMLPTPLQNQWVTQQPEQRPALYK